MTRDASYLRHLRASADWLRRSVDSRRGGSRASFSPVAGWARPYPETTGYIIPTLLRLDARFPGEGFALSAVDLGHWLLSIQNADGSWQGGLHPPRADARPSVFNTGQILNGLVALLDHTGESRWRDALHRGAGWLASRVEQGAWPAGDYRSQSMPSYYAHAAWPLLQSWKATGDDSLRDAGSAVLRRIASRRRENGSYAEWSFSSGKPAFTHTIAYTLWGLIAGAELIDQWEEVGKPAALSLDRLIRAAELRNGKLAGAYDDQWRPNDAFVCLTGNAQIALCILAVDRRSPDLRLVNAACKLVDFVCDRQSLSSPLPAIRGAVAGSSPLWGRYMTMRYPNWAAKFHADALMDLIDRLERERSIAS